MRVELDYVNTIPSAFSSFYRTDSETTDDQCIPESLSERSAIESQDSDPDTGDACTILTREPVKEDADALMPSDELLRLSELKSFLDVRDSSTESDKTVLSITTAAQDGLPEVAAVNKLTLLSHALPQIVIEESTDSPSPLAQSMDPSSPRPATHESSARDEKEPPPTHSRRTRKTTSSPMVRIPKASSVPNAYSIFESSAYKYEQLDAPDADSVPLSPHSVSTYSSRSESPLSENYVDKCKSLLALNAAQRLIESDGVLEFKEVPEAVAEGKESTKGVATRNRSKKKRLKKRSQLNRSLLQLEETPAVPKDKIVLESLTHKPSSLSVFKGPFNSRHQVMIQEGVKSAVQSSSSESIHSLTYV